MVAAVDGMALPHLRRCVSTELPPLTSVTVQARGRRRLLRFQPTLWPSCDTPKKKKQAPKSYGGHAWAEELLLPGGIFPLIISNDDDDDNLVSVSELFAKADP